VLKLIYIINKAKLSQFTFEPVVGVFGVIFDLVGEVLLSGDLGFS